MTTPRPVKKPICSAARATVPPTGDPIPDTAPLFHSGLRVLPTANHAPANAASHAPNIAIGRRLVTRTMRPPTMVAAPGAISSQTPPEVRYHARPGVEA